MNFRISGLPVAPFTPFFAMSDAELLDHGARRLVAAVGSNHPCRVTLAAAEPGETVILLPYQHQPEDSPYRSAGPIFVRESARETFDAPDRVPEIMRRRLISVRAYDARHWIVDADVVAGTDIEPVIERLFAQSDVAYLHAHNAKYGCYAGRIDRG